MLGVVGEVTTPATLRDAITATLSCKARDRSGATSPMVVWLADAVLDGVREYVATPGVDLGSALDALGLEVAWDVPLGGVVYVAGPRLEGVGDGWQRITHGPAIVVRPRGEQSDAG